MKSKLDFEFQKKNYKIVQDIPLSSIIWGAINYK